MRKLLTVLVAIASIATATVAASDSADARWLGGGRGGGWNGGWRGGGWNGGWRGGGWNGGWRGAGWRGWGGVGLGLAAGAVVGSALAAPYYGFGYGSNYGYGTSGYGYTSDYGYTSNYGYPSDYSGYGYAPAYGDTYAYSPGYSYASPTYGHLYARYQPGYHAHHHVRHY